MLDIQINFNTQEVKQKLNELEEQIDRILDKQKQINDMNTEMDFDIMNKVLQMNVIKKY
jgi:hypothetical protein